MSLEQRIQNTLGEMNLMILQLQTQVENQQQEINRLKEKAGESDDE